jgi:hypothetical protein
MDEAFATVVASCVAEMGVSVVRPAVSGAAKVGGGSPRGVGASSGRICLHLHSIRSQVWLAMNAASAVVASCVADAGAAWVVSAG